MQYLQLGKGFLTRGKEHSPRPVSTVAQDEISAPSESMCTAPNEARPVQSTVEQDRRKLSRNQTERADESDAIWPLASGSLKTLNMAPEPSFPGLPAALPLIKNNRGASDYLYWMKYRL